MDRRQRLGDWSETIDLIFRNHQAAVQTAMPGIVQSFDVDAMTAVVQPTIQGVVSDPKTGAVANPNLPLLLDVPVCFPGWGGVTMTFPIAQGDECLVVFASRCIDAWWQNGGVQPPLDYRMHDLSDGFMIPGGRSQPRVLSNISTSTAQFRSDDGSTYVEVDPTGQRVNMVAPGGIYLNGIKFDTHKHSGVQTGSGISGAPQ